MNNCTGSAKGLPFLASNTTCNKTIRENYHIPHLALSPPTTVPNYCLALKFPSPISDLRQALGTQKTILIMIVTIIKDITFPHKPCLLIPPWECFFPCTLLASLHLIFNFQSWIFMQNNKVSDPPITLHWNASMHNKHTYKQTLGGSGPEIKHQL